MLHTLNAYVYNILNMNLFVINNKLLLIRLTKFKYLTKPKIIILWINFI